LWHTSAHEPLCPSFRSICLDCIVAVVDARHIERQLADPRPAGAVNEAQQQVAFADVVLLNKVGGDDAAAPLL
jgi:G3E family GTPase